MTEIKENESPEKPDKPEKNALEADLENPDPATEEELEALGEGDGTDEDPEDTDGSAAGGGEERGAREREYVAVPEPVDDGDQKPDEPVKLKTTEIPVEQLRNMWQNTR